MPGARIADGERVTLRTLEREDLSFHQRGCANPEIRYPLGNPIRNRGQLEDGWNEDDENGEQFLVCLDDNETPKESRADGKAVDDSGPGRPDEEEIERIGGVSVEDADWRRPELGYWLVPEVHGQGYGREAVALVIEYVFRTYAHPAVGARAYEFNDASRGLLGSLGFAEEGRVRKDRFIDGEYVDTIVYGLLREEWRED